MNLLSSILSIQFSRHLPTKALYTFGKCETRTLRSVAGIDSPSGTNYFYHCDLDHFTKRMVEDNFQIYDGFVTHEEEEHLLRELNPCMKRMRYEIDHWDNAIHSYKETERLHWNEINSRTIKKIREFAFPKGSCPMEHVHILDLSEDGHIKPHVDSIRFCGDFIAGLSLLSDGVMRLANKNVIVDTLLRRRSLYIMTGPVRYNFTHEILPNDISVFKNQHIKKSRRMSVIFRSAPVNTA